VHGAALERSCVVDLWWSGASRGTWRECWLASLSWSFWTSLSLVLIVSQLTRELIDALVFWNQTLGFTMIAVDHEAEVLRRLCPGQATVIENGKVVQRGIWEDLYCALATPLLRSLLAPL
jgi:hypothetical protein